MAKRLSATSLNDKLLGFKHRGPVFETLQWNQYIKYLIWVFLHSLHTGGPVENNWWKYFASGYIFFGDTVNCEEGIFKERKLWEGQRYYIGVGRNLGVRGMADVRINPSHCGARRRVEKVRLKRSKYLCQPASPDPTEMVGGRILLQ